MPHVSKKKLDQVVSGKIFRKLVRTLEQAKGSDRLTLVLHELFTPTEKIMLAKRLAIVLMLSGNTPQHRIAEVLHVSPTTVTKISLHVEFGKYKSILGISKPERLDLERMLWNLLTVGGIMPPRVGGKYWRKYKRK